jgi:hypothetical protein
MCEMKKRGSLCVFGDPQNVRFFFAKARDSQRSLQPTNTGRCRREGAVD